MGGGGWGVEGVKERVQGMNREGSEIEAFWPRIFGKHALIFITCQEE